MLIKKLAGAQAKGKKCVVGIAGVHQGVGTTHTAIMVANYLTRYKKQNCVAIEMNESEDFLQLQCATSNLVGYEEDRQFGLMGVTYIRSETETGLIARLNEDYDCYIIDFGVLTQRNQNEFLRCDVKLAIGSLAEWKRHRFHSFVHANRQLHGFSNWKFCMVFGQDRDMAIDGRELKLLLHGVGYNPDPFILNSETVRLFHRLFEGTYR